LAVWLGQGGYYFSSHDDKSKNPNVYKPIEYGDIEGVWTYLYFSYSGLKNLAVGFLRTTETKSIEL
jgi:hypothetical protein